ncbi:MAG: hypothetical protein LBK96_06850 [Prevotellaceae bacterium]|nr:hypothetical protein [Prevotellaceae bacterium]
MKSTDVLLKNTDKFQSNMYGFCKMPSYFLHIPKMFSIENKMFSIENFKKPDADCIQISIKCPIFAPLKNTDDGFGKIIGESFSSGISWFGRACADV